jgi:hypothetical protein
MALGQDLPTSGEAMASEIPTGKKFPLEMDLMWFLTLPTPDMATPCLKEEM